MDQQPIRSTRPSPDVLRAAGNGTAALPPRPSDLHPKTVAMIDEQNRVRDERDEYFAVAQKQAVELDLRDRRIAALEEELRDLKEFSRGELRAERARASKFESGLLGIKAELGMIAVGGQALASACEGAVQRAQDELRRVGIVEEPAAEARPQGQGFAVDTAALGAALGARTRDAEADAREDAEIRGERP